MDALLEQLTRLLHEIGLWVVLAVTFTETAFFIGLLIPAEATILMAAFLASRGYYSVWLVLAATFMGGLLGDQTGFFLGRYGGTRLVARKGRLARLWQKHEPRAARLFGKHASLSISLARFISFVRTLMPWFAGMSHMPYGKFLVFDMVGVFGWAAASVAVGYLAGESWEAAAQTLGRTSALAVGAVLLVAFIGMRVRRRRALRGPLPPPSKLRRVALTGNIASGKSSVLAVWRELGAQVIDADVLAHQAIEPGTPGFQTVARTFGPDVQGPDGAIDRARLRARVFNDEGARKRLEAILHPEVARLREEEERRLAAAGATLIVNDIPLLFETGLDDQFDVIVLVHANAETRLQRIVQSRGLSPDEARSMIAAQMPSEQKRSRSHFVIANEGTMAELRERARQVWEELVAWPGSA